MADTPDTRSCASSHHQPATPCHCQQCCEASESPGACMPSARCAVKSPLPWCMHSNDQMCSCPCGWHAMACCSCVWWAVHSCGGLDCTSVHAAAGHQAGVANACKACTSAPCALHTCILYACIGACTHAYNHPMGHPKPSSGCTSCLGWASAGGPCWKWGCGASYGSCHMSHVHHCICGPVNVQ